MNLSIKYTPAALCQLNNSRVSVTGLLGSLPAGLAVVDDNVYKKEKIYHLRNPISLEDRHTILIAPTLLLEAAQVDKSALKSATYVLLEDEDVPVVASSILVGKNRNIRTLSFQMDKWNRILDANTVAARSYNKREKSELLSQLNGDGGYNRILVSRLLGAAVLAGRNSQALELMHSEIIKQILLKRSLEERKKSLSRLFKHTREVIRIFQLRNQIGVPHYPEGAPIPPKQPWAEYTVWQAPKKQVDGIKKVIGDNLLARGEYLWRLGVELKDSTLTDRAHEYASLSIDAYGERLPRSLELKALGLLCGGVPEQYLELECVAQDEYGSKQKFAQAVIAAAKRIAPKHYPQKTPQKAVDLAAAAA